MKAKNTVVISVNSVDKSLGNSISKEINSILQSEKYSDYEFRDIIYNRYLRIQSESLPDIPMEFASALIILEKPHIDS